jgi:predicted Rossmann fold nucleotide-binding protein DprA/Smf involved in DNA uptake
MAAELLERIRAQIDARLLELRPAVAEYERLLGAAEALERESAQIDAKPRELRMGAVERAIVAALEHGSHTLAELVLVTAMSASELRASLRRLQRAGTVARASREGRTAYALSGRQ